MNHKPIIGFAQYEALKALGLIDSKDCIILKRGKFLTDEQNKKNKAKRKRKKQR